MAEQGVAVDGGLFSASRGATSPRPPQLNFAFGDTIRRLRMRWAVTGALFLGLLIAADLTYLVGTRNLNAYEHYEDLKRKETSYFREKEEQTLVMWGMEEQIRILPHREKELRAQIHAYHLTRRELVGEEWQTHEKTQDISAKLREHLYLAPSNCMLGLEFLGCGLIWLVVIMAIRRATEPGSLPHWTLKGSIIGAILIGTCYAGFMQVLPLVFQEGEYFYDRSEWERRWLGGAIGGAAVGALFGLVAGVVLNLFRRNQNSGKADIQLGLAEPIAPADRPRE